MTVNPHNPYGVVMAYVVQKGQPELQKLFAEFGIPANPSLENIRAAINKHGIKFLYAFDNRIIRPYSKELHDKLNQINFSGAPLLEGFTPATQYAAQSSAADMASKKKDPERGTKILTGITTGLDALGTIFGGVQQIKGGSAQPATMGGGTSVPAVAREEEEKNKKVLMYVAIGLVVAIIGLFAYMKFKK